MPSEISYLADLAHRCATQLFKNVTSAATAYLSPERRLLRGNVFDMVENLDGRRGIPEYFQDGAVRARIEPTRQCDRAPGCERFHLVTKARVG